MNQRMQHVQVTRNLEECEVQETPALNQRMQLQTGEFQIKAEDATYKEFISQVQEALALKQRMQLSLNLIISHRNWRSRGTCAKSDYAT
ncbi:MAG: hypothetical protein Q8P40_13580 [Nitrospirota bacterium]|nr:hypothetical protein [Nitrospirota bacterium]